MGRWLTVVIAVVIFAIDQASKWWVLDVMDLRERGVIEILPILDFALAWNTGVNFGLFASGAASQQYILAGFAVIVSIVLLVWSWRASDPRFWAAAGLVIGGALGNALDRVREGAVVDFLNFDCCGIGNPFAFNVADTAIFLGAIGLAIFLWRDDADDRSSKTVQGDKG